MSQITIKTADEMALMRAAGKAAASVLNMVAPEVRAGITTAQLDRLCHDYIVDEIGGVPAPLNYRGSGAVPFPKSVCTSVNHVICHGIPDDKPLKDGDVVNIDVTVIKDGFHGDTSRMFVVGRVFPQTQLLIDTTYQAMCAGIRAIKPGATLGDIGHAVSDVAQQQGFWIVREYCGHGIGRGFHEPPQVMHYGKPGTGVRLVEGMTFTVEPMVNLKRSRAKLLPDHWTVTTGSKRNLSAQWEHTIAVTPDGFEVLTLAPDEVI